MFYYLTRAWILLKLKLISFVLSKRFVILLPFLWMIIFFLLPCIFLLKISFSEFVLASPPYKPICEFLEQNILNIKLNFSSYISIFADDIYFDGFLTSIMLAGISTICCLVIGFPMAYAIIRAKSEYRKILLMLIVMPFWTSFLIRVYSWIVLLSPAGIINNFLMQLGIISAPLQLINNSFAACIGIVYCYLPFMIFPLYAAMEKIDFSMLEAAYDLGSTPFKTFFSIVIPLSANGAFSGSVLVFIPAIGEYVIPELLGGPQTLTIGRLVWNEFFSNLSWANASAIAIILLLFVVLPIMVIQSMNERKQKKLQMIK